MDPQEIKRLRYRRQYLLSPEVIECPFIHNTRKIGKFYHLYTHVDLLVSEYTSQGVTIILLGDIFDYEFPKKNNDEILQDLLDEDFDKFTDKSSKYSGRYVILYIAHDNIRLLHDATATRKVYYSTINSKMWFSSQPHLLAKVLHLEKTTDESKVAFYSSEDFTRLFNSNIGDHTCYDEISQLMPNHFYIVVEQKSVRYWPNKKIDFMPVSVVAAKCASILQGYANSIALRYNIMLPVTAGKDSRLLFAATKDFRKNVYYYLNKEPEINENSTDYTVPKSLLSKLGLDYHLEYQAESVDSDFAEVYYENNKMASTHYLPFIYNYYSKFSDKVNLPGNIASGGIEYYKMHKLKVTPETLIKLTNLQDYPFALQYYTEWLNNCREVCNKHNVNILNLFYWEERLANWGTQIQMEKDIAQEDINILSSRLLATHLFSVKPTFIMGPNFVLQRKIIRNLWSDALLEPINPGLLNGFKRLLQTIGLLESIYKIKFKFFGRG